MPHIDFAVGIGGAAGQGVATPGNILAKLFARRGLHINAYNAYQSIIRGGHTFLTIRTSERPVRCMGDDLAMLIPLNQDTMDRHLKRMRAGSAVLYDGDRVRPGAATEGVQLCPLPLAQLARNLLYYNTAAVAAVLRLVGVELKPFEEMLAQQFQRKGDAVVAENVTAARAGYDYAGAHFKPYAFSLPDTGKRLAVEQELPTLGFFRGAECIHVGSECRRPEDDETEPGTRTQASHQLTPTRLRTASGGPSNVCDGVLPT